MSLFKKITAAALAAAAALSFTACGKDTTWGAEIDGLTLRAGMLIYFQSEALSEAQAFMQEGDENVLDITIENQPARDWINAKAVEKMQEYAAVESKYSELGLSFEDKEEERVSIVVDQWWEYIGTYYEELGVSKQSYLDVGLNGEKRAAVFDYYYGEGGERAVAEEEIISYLNENYARIKYIEMPLKDGEENLLKSEGKAEIMKMAKGYIDRLSASSATFEEIAEEYNDYYASLSASAEENGEENIDDDTDEETGGEEADYGTVISKESSFPSAKAVEEAFKLSGGAGGTSYTVVEEDEVYYLVAKLDLFADPDYLENNRSSVLHSLKDEEFEETISGWTSSQSVNVNQDAVKRYKLDKMVD